MTWALLTALAYVLTGMLWTRFTLWANRRRKNPAPVDGGIVAILIVAWPVVVLYAIGAAIVGWPE